MKTSVKAGLLFALIWIIVILIAFLTGRSIDFFLISELLSLLLLLGAVFTGLFMTKREKNYEKSNALEDFKIAMQSGLVYTILVTGFVYIYHNQIDTTIQESFIAQRIDVLHEEFPDEASFIVYQAKDPKWKDLTYNDFIENIEDQAKTFIGPFFTSFFHLMVFFMFSLFYSFFVTLVIRKIILRE